MNSLKICKVCTSNNLIPFISFGKMPVANAFLKKDELDKSEFTYDMDVGFCKNCKMVQLINIVPYERYIVPDETGKTNYAFFSSTSKVMEQHFAELAKEVERRFMTNSEIDKVLEIGSNDGIMLKSFKNRKNVVGIEPSRNVAEIAISQGIETITEFFSQNLARKIKDKKGKFRAVLATNVTLNIINLHDFFEGIKELLDERGIFITEDPYIVDILEKTSYDQIYDEHIWYFSLASFSHLCEMHGMDIFDAERQDVHGGSMRVYICRRGIYRKTEKLKILLDKEEEKGTSKIETYLDFAKRAEESKKELVNLLIDLKSKGKKIVGYAAASKGTIVLNYCDIGRETLDYISDSTPYKQGLFSPGKHIPLVSPDYFHNDKNVEYALLGAWNHAEEIMKKEQDFLKRGGRFIVHYPKARILEAEPREKVESHADTTQSSEFIEGVEVKRLKVFANDQGYLFETLRNDDPFYNKEFGQVLIFEVYPGVIKGYHLHQKHDEYVSCIKGNIKYIVVKEYPDGTKKVNKFIIGEKNPMLIKIPRGLWRGYMPLANQPAMVMDIMSKLYDPKDPDTSEKDPFAFGDLWSVKKG